MTLPLLLSGKINYDKFTKLKETVISPEDVKDEWPFRKSENSWYYTVKQSIGHFVEIDIGENIVYFRNSYSDNDYEIRIPKGKFVVESFCILDFCLIIPFSLGLTENITITHYICGTKRSETDKFIQEQLDKDPEWLTRDNTQETINGVLWVENNSSDFHIHSYYIEFDNSIHKVRGFVTSRDTKYVIHKNEGCSEFIGGGKNAMEESGLFEYLTEEKFNCIPHKKQLIELFSYF